VNIVSVDLYTKSSICSINSERYIKRGNRSIVPTFCHVVIDRVGESTCNRGLPMVGRIVSELNDEVSPQVIGDESHANYSHGHQSIEVIMVLPVTTIAASISPRYPITNSLANLLACRAKPRHTIVGKAM